MTATGYTRLAGALLVGRYGLFALVSVAVAIVVGLPAAVLFAWIALAQLIVATAYLLGEPALFGKRPDGRLGWLPALLLLPYLAFLTAFFHLKRWTGYGEPAFAEVAPRVWVGRRLLPRELPDEVDCVADLTAEYSEPRGIVDGRRYHCLPTLNRFIPPDDVMEGLLATLAAEPGTLYVHCGAGKGRSAAVAAGVMVLRGLAADVDEAEEIVRRKRAQVRLHPVQREQLRRLCRSRSA